MFHMKLNLLIHQTEKKILYKITLQNQQISPETNILGDSKTKLLKGWEKANIIQSNCKIYVKTFTQINGFMYGDYMKPSLRNLPDNFILHVATNDLSSEKSSMKTAQSITNLACRLKSEMHDVNVSIIMLRIDDKKLNENGMEVNLR